MTIFHSAEKEAMISIIQAKHRTNHILHIILCILTGGFWIPIWFLVAVCNSCAQDAVVRRHSPSVPVAAVSLDRTRYNNTFDSNNPDWVARQNIKQLLRADRIDPTIDV